MNELLLIAQDKMPGVSGINKFGSNPASAQDTQEDIWDGSAAYSYPATALMTSMSQTAHQAAMRGKVIELQGLNGSWEPVTQTKALDASDTTTVITLDTPMIRVFRMKVLADVVGNQNIRCHNAGETQDYAIIRAGLNQTAMAIYTVPAGKKALILDYYGDAVPTVALGPSSVNFKLWVADRGNSYEFQMKHAKGAWSGAAVAHSFQLPIAVPEKSDIKMTALSNDKASEVHAGFDLVLVNQ
jgi:hypothetical protein